MIERAVVLPCPPLLLPGATGAELVPEVEFLRVACLDALETLSDSGLSSGSDSGSDSGFDSGFDNVFLAGAGRSGERGTAVGHRNTPWPGREALSLPVSLAVGASLAEATGVSIAEKFTVAEDTPADECVALGVALAARPGRNALVVMGDGSARRNTTAPGYLDERSIPFDTAIENALRGGDFGVLAALDVDLAAQLWAGGRAVWQVLAGALDADVRGWKGEVRYSDDPFGVWYGVVELSPTA